MPLTGSGRGASIINPYLKRWMLFVDGENLTIRGQALAAEHGVVLPEGSWFRRDVFLWLHSYPHATQGLHPLLGHVGVQDRAVRAFYYTSVHGDTDAVLQTQEALWNLGFTPEVFKKGSRNAKAKGVDIALTKDLLSNAFLENYDVAVVITGDADYRPVITEVKRLGKSVCLMALVGAGAKVSRELRLSADYFIEMNNAFLSQWSTASEDD